MLKNPAIKWRIQLLQDILNVKNIEVKYLCWYLCCKIYYYKLILDPECSEKSVGLTKASVFFFTF